jgi:hypothetical protein
MGISLYRRLLVCRHRGNSFKKRAKNKTPRRTYREIVKNKGTAFYNYQQDRLSRESFKEVKEDIDKQTEAINHEEEPIVIEKVENEDDITEFTREIIERYIDRVLVDNEGNIEVFLKEETLHSK